MNAVFTPLSIQFHEDGLQKAVRCLEKLTSRRSDCEFEIMNLTNRVQSCGPKPTVYETRCIAWATDRINQLYIDIRGLSIRIEEERDKLHDHAHELWLRSETVVEQTVPTERMVSTPIYIGPEKHRSGKRRKRRRYPVKDEQSSASKPKEQDRRQRKQRQRAA